MPEAMFPFTFKYQYALGRKLSDQESWWLLDYLKGVLKARSVNNFEESDRQLVFRITFGETRSQTSIMNFLEKGGFSLIETHEGAVITYEISMYRKVIIGLVLSVIMGLVAHWGVGVFFFLVLVVLPWIITVVQHSNLFSRIFQHILRTHQQMRNPYGKNG